LFNALQCPLQERRIADILEYLPEARK